MRGACAGTDAPLLGGFKWLPWGPPFAMHGWKRNVGIQVLWDLMTVARQLGETAASALKPSHMYVYKNIWNGISKGKYKLNLHLWVGMWVRKR